MNSDRHARIKEIFLAVCELTPDERDEFLERSCTDDHGLRREVESLLKQHDDSNPGDDLPDLDITASLTMPQAPPKKVGNYIVLQKIGEGGMGEVYLAEQLKPVKRRVALKLIKWGMDTKEVVARFESERQALALMNHPCIASVFDAGATDEGRPYFAMEHVAGDPVTVYCEKHRVPIGERLNLFLEACEGVQHAHQKGIIHRDIKPSNILVTIVGDKPVPKIIDFGIAKATAGHLTDKTVCTQLGHWVGTPEYMSPEQAERTGVDVDTRTDVYSLGMVLYELLAGAQPFDTAELRKADLDSIPRILREWEPPKPSRKVQLPALKKALSGDLDWITMKAIEKDRCRRYGSPADMAADIRRHLRNEPILASPPSTSYRVKKFVRRHRLGVTAISLVLVALLLGIIGTTLGFFEAARQRDAARSARDAAEREAAKAQTISQFLQETLSSASPREGIGRAATVLDALDIAVSRAGPSFADQPEVEAAVQQAIGRIYLELGRYDAAERWLTSALKMREPILGREHEEVAESLVSLGELALYWKNDATTAEAHFREALTMQRRLLGGEHLDVAGSLHNLALARTVAGDYEEAKRLTREALEIEHRVTGSERPGTLTSLATLEHYTGDYEVAEAHFREALDMLRKKSGDWNFDVSAALSNLGSLLHDKGDDRGAESLFRESVAILRERLGDAHIAVAATSANVAMTLASQGKDDESQRLYEEAIAIFPEVLTRELHHYAQRRIAYGLLMMRRGRYEEAERHLTAGLEVFRARLDPDDERIRIAARHLAELYEARNKPAPTSSSGRRI